MIYRFSLIRFSVLTNSNPKYLSTPNPGVDAKGGGSAIIPIFEFFLFFFPKKAPGKYDIRRTLVLKAKGVKQ